MPFYLFLALFILAGILFSNTAQAVPPPDFIFNVGRQVIQLFTLLVLGLSVGATFIKNFFQTNVFYNKHKTWIWIVVGIFIIAASYLIANWYGAFSQKQEYSKWLKESQSQTSSIDANSVAVNSVPTANKNPDLQVLPYFLQNSTTPESISNKEFKTVPPNAYILDAREDEEYQNGKYPGSRHIRFADLVDGAWTDLPTNQPVYVLCWSGIRGKETADFLRTKNILARYLEKGADGWVTFGGKWDGAIKFRSVYTDPKYEIVFSTEEVKSYASQGVALVDSRPKEKYNQKHIAGSINIPIIYTPSNKIEAALGQVKIGSSVITICDDFVSCFDATIVGAKFEKRGVTFLGRYNKPWDY